MNLKFGLERNRIIALRFVLIFTLIINLNGFSQISQTNKLPYTIYYDVHDVITDDLTDFTFFKTVSYYNDSVVEVIKYFKDSTKLSCKYYSKYDEANEDKSVLSGVSVWYYYSGKIQKKISYSEGLKQGNFITNWESGIVKRSDTYSSDSLVSGSCFNSLGVKVEYFEYIIYPKLKCEEEDIERAPLRK